MIGSHILLSDASQSFGNWMANISRNLLICLSTHLSIVAIECFSQNHDLIFWLFAPVDARCSVNIIIFERFSQTNLMLRHIAQRLIQAFLITNRCLHLLILRVGRHTIRHVLAGAVPVWALCPGVPVSQTKNSRLGIQSVITNNMWPDSRNRMLEQNVKALTTCKIIIDFSWCHFYEKIQSNKDFWKKYDWANGEIYKCLNIVFFLGKLYYFSSSWCLNYRNPNNFILGYYDYCHIGHTFTTGQARRHGEAFGGSAPVNLFCSPQILLCPEKFVLNI